MIAISYSTNEKYKDLAQKALESAERQGITTKLYEYPDKGSWARNLNLKPTCLLDALGEHKTDDILFLDADTEVLGPPKLFYECPSFGAAYHPEPGKPNSGVMYFKFEMRSVRLLEAWITESQVNPEHYDDVVNLVAALKKTRLKLWNLPPAYNWMERDMRGRFPLADPIILHHQVGEHNAKI